MFFFFFIKNYFDYNNQSQAEAKGAIIKNSNNADIFCTKV